MQTWEDSMINPVRRLQTYAPVLIFYVVSMSCAREQSFVSDIMVAHKGINSVGFYSAEGKHLKTVDIGPNPHEIVISPDRQYAYVTNNGVMRWMDEAPGGNTISIVDLATREKTGEISTGEFRRPHGIDLDPQTGLIAVTCELPDRLLLVDPLSKKVLRDFDTGGVTSHNVVLNTGATLAVVTNITSATAGMVDLAAGEVTVIPVGPSPQDAVFSSDESLLYIACSDAVHIIDVKKRTDIGVIDESGGPRIDITSDGSTLLFAKNDGVLTFIDTATGTITGRVKLPHPLFSISISQNGLFAFSSAEPENEIYIVSIPERKLVRSVTPVEGARPDPVWDVPSQ